MICCRKESHTQCEGARRFASGRVAEGGHRALSGQKTNSNPVKPLTSLVMIPVLPVFLVFLDKLRFGVARHFFVMAEVFRMHAATTSQRA